MKPSQMHTFLTESFKNRFQVILSGPPGCGKSEIVIAAAKDVGYPVIISHPAVADPTDFKGMPFIDKDGNASFVPFAELRQLVDANEPLIYFLDDVGQALPGTQAALMQLVLGKRVNDHKVSDHVIFIAATNRREDMAGVMSLIEPLKSRFRSIVPLEPDLNDWVAWAFQNDLAPEIIGFMKARPHYLTDFTPTQDITNSACARTIYFASDWVKSDLPRELLPEAIAGCAGKAFSDEFIGVMETRANIPNLFDMLDDPDNAPVPSETDIMFSIVVGLTFMANASNIDAIFKYAKRIGPEYQMALLTDIRTKHEHLVNTRPYIEFAADHKEFFTV